MRIGVMTARRLVPPLAAATLAGCASLGGPGARTCAPYLVGGAALGGGVGAATASDGGRVRRGVEGAVVGAAAGYGVCVAVWQQKRELEARFAALEEQTKRAGGEKSGPAATTSAVVRSIDVLDNRALRLDLDLNFATARAMIEPGVAAHLSALAANLNVHPNSRILVVGHTDNTGDPSRNRALSLQRATAVATYLSQQGVAADRFEMRGMGSDQPVADNTTVAGQLRNRRVEVIIVPTSPT
jgi:outer membrane protein OmpA-like peptidoglycan-associated protein